MKPINIILTIAAFCMMAGFSLLIFGKLEKSEFFLSVGKSVLAFGLTVSCFPLLGGIVLLVINRIRKLFRKKQI